MGKLVAKIPIVASAITKDQQYVVCDLLCRAGYKTWVSKGKVRNGRGTTYIHVEEVENGENESEDEYDV